MGAYHLGAASTYVLGFEGANLMIILELEFGCSIRSVSSIMPG
jgi:hypothetical protein